jgi:hypothetical protein
MQYVDAARQDVPLLYYDAGSALSDVFARFGAGFGEIGVVGLGVGTIAAYGRPGERMDFYELDGDVERIARESFTYLARSRAKVAVVTGDARLSLAARPGARYDLLVLDAFSGGAIPVHLLTREAFELYLDRLSPGGLILVHITNRLLNLRPVLAASAEDLGLAGAAKAADPREVISQERTYSSWAALSRDPAKIARLEASGWRGEATPKGCGPGRTNTPAFGRHWATAARLYKAAAAQRRRNCLSSALPWFCRSCLPALWSCGERFGLIERLENGPVIAMSISPRADLVTVFRFADWAPMSTVPVVVMPIKGLSNWKGCIVITPLAAA